MFKCQGHLHKVEGKSFSTYYLVMEQDASTYAKPGAILVSNQSSGFLERVIAINKTSDSLFVHTKLVQCTEETNISSRFVIFRQIVTGKRSPVLQL